MIKWLAAEVAFLMIMMPTVVEAGSAGPTSKGDWLIVFLLAMLSLAIVIAARIYAERHR